MLISLAEAIFQIFFFFHKSVLLNTLYVRVLVKKNIEPMKCSKKRFGQNLLNPQMFIFPKIYILELGGFDPTAEI